MKSSKPQFVGKKVKLGELCEICSGGTPKRSVAEYWKDGTIPWVKIGDMSEKYVSSTEERITDAGFNNSSVKMLEPGTLLYSIFASIGAVSILKIPATTNQAIAGLKIKDDSLDRDFLYHYLKSRESISKSSGRGAAQNNINLTILRNMQVTLPSIEIQRSIVRNLEMISNQVTIAESHLMDLDALVKSRFIEMFGDPVEENRWARITLASLCTKLGSGATPRGGKAAYKTSGIPLIRSMNVHNGYFESKDLAYIDEIQAKKLDNVTLHKGDVLLNITGASVARSCLLPDYLAGGRVNQHVSIVRCDPNRMLPRVLNSIFTSDSYQRFLLEHSRMAGATREEITKDDLETMTVPLPPLSLQYKFAAFVAQVDKSRFGGMLHLLNSLSGIMHASFFSVADTD